MIQVESNHKVSEMEAALCRAAQKHGAHIVSITPFSALVKEEARRAAHDAISFTLCHTELYGALIAADIRFATFLPCRIAAVSQGEGAMLETISPKHFCRFLNRPDLERLVAPLETLLRELMTDAARRSALHPPRTRTEDSVLGAREGQVSMRASIPQRIDCHGTKVEDLAGTGQVDAPGG
ncbi:MAG: hypothetical protein GY953_25895 [bacterium]|nr:hypothetical protein [bacterium]